MAENSRPEMTKARLLEQVRAGRRELEETLAGLPPDLFAEPGAAGEWSVKDVLFHLAAWERRLVSLLRAARGEAEPPDLIRSSDDVERFNARAHAESRDRPLAEALAESRASHERVGQEIERLGEPELLDPRRFAWLEGAPLWRNVEMDTYGHYREHLPAIRALSTRRHLA